MNKWVFLIFGIALSAFSQTFLSGEIKGAFPRDNYIVSSDLSVKFGDTLFIAAGSELRFKPNTGLMVRGVFIASGTPQDPIIMTSAQEQSAKTSGVDSQAINVWKGIDFSASKVMSQLSYCLICFCDTALVIKNSFQKVDFDHVVFHKNKSVNILWAGKPVETEDDVQYLHKVDASDNIQPKPSMPKKVAGDIAYGLQSQWKPISRSVFSLLSITGTGIALYGYFKAKEHDRQYDRMIKNPEPEDVRKMAEQRDKMVGLRDTGFAFSMVGAGLFFVTFFF
jgi:hypothetical protein